MGKTDLLQKGANHSHIHTLVEKDVISYDLYHRALDLAGIRPNKAQWKQFIELVFVSLGTGFLLFGILSFFAYNWVGLPPMYKFLIVQSLIVASAIIASLKPADTLFRKIALTAASVFTGIFLAIYGQVYQTGADRYELFLSWAVLISGWVVICRFSALWFFWILLVNLSIVLFIGDTFDGGLENYYMLAFILLPTNALFLVTAEWRNKKEVQDGASPWLLYALLIITLTSITWITILISQLHTDPDLIIYLFYAVIIIPAYWYYYRQKNLFAMALCYLSIGFTATNFLAIVFKMDSKHMLYLSVYVLVLATGFVHHLRKLQSGWQSE